MRGLGLTLIVIGLVANGLIGNAADGRLWLPDGAIARVGLDQIGDVAFSSDGSYLAVAGTPAIYLLDMEWLQTVAWVPVLDGGSVTSVAFAPEGYLFAATSYLASVRMWEFDVGATEVWSVSGGIYAYPEVSVAFSPDGQLVASGDGGGTVTLRDAGTGTPLRTLNAYHDSVLALGFSPDGQLLATGGGAAQLWDVGTGKQVAVLQERAGSVGTLDFSPDGTLLATGLDNLAAEVWDVATHDLVLSLRLEDSANAVAFSPDGTLLVVGERGGVLRIYSVATGLPLRLLAGHEEPITAIAFSPSGDVLVSGSTDGTIVIWDATEWVALLP